MDIENTPTPPEVVVDPTEQAIAKALVLLWQVNELLTSVLRTLPSDERNRLPTVPHEFPAAAVSMLDAITLAPKLAALCEDLDPADIGARLHLTTLLDPLGNRLDRLVSLVAGARETALRTAFTDTLPVYRIAKEAAAVDPNLQMVVTPLHDVYAARKKPVKKTTT